MTDPYATLTPAELLDLAASWDVSARHQEKAGHPMTARVCRETAERLRLKARQRANSLEAV